MTYKILQLFLFFYLSELIAFSPYLALSSLVTLTNFGFHEHIRKYPAYLAWQYFFFFRIQDLDIFIWLPNAAPSGLQANVIFLKVFLSNFKIIIYQKYYLFPLSCFVFTSWILKILMLYVFYVIPGYFNHFLKINFVPISIYSPVLFFPSSP